MEAPSGTSSRRLLKGVHWSRIQTVPEEWSVVNLSSELHTQAGGAFKSRKFDEETGVPLIRIRDLGTGETTVRYSGEFDPQYRVETGDLLVGMDGEFRPHLWSGGRAVLNQRVCKLKSESYNEVFLRYALEKPLRLIEASIAGTTVKHLSTADFDKINLATPPVEEQRKIASVLYTVDELITNTTEAITRLDRVKRGVRSRIFQYGVRGEPLQETDSRFGKLPESWSLQRLDDVTDVIGGTTPSRDQEDYWGGGIPWVTPTDITELEGQKIDSTPRTITDKAVAECTLTILPARSVLLTSRASIGNCAVNTVPMTTNQGFQSLVSGEEIDPWYLYYLTSEMAPYLESLGAGSTFSEISNSVVRKVTVPVPTKEEQSEIAETLRNFDRVISSNKSFKQRAVQLKKGLMQDLLTGEVRTKNVDIEIPEEVAAYG